MAGLIFPQNPVLACGMCLDTEITGIMPFLFYWLILCVIWTIIAGPICLAVIRRNEKPKARNPAWLFLSFFILYIMGSILSNGAVVGAFILIIPFWLVGIARALRQRTSVFWSKVNLVLLSIILICVPVSYLVPKKPFDEYRRSMEEIRMKHQTHEWGFARGGERGDSDRSHE